MKVLDFLSLFLIGFLLNFEAIYETFKRENFGFVLCKFFNAIIVANTDLRQ
tara:strand:+ start:344 stop:496 length:153 start_codon:yes stop_codon:yes gene_type:complete